MGRQVRGHLHSECDRPLPCSNGSSPLPIVGMSGPLSLPYTACMIASGFSLHTDTHHSSPHECMENVCSQFWIFVPKASICVTVSFVFFFCGVLSVSFSLGGLCIGREKQWTPSFGILLRLSHNRPTWCFPETFTQTMYSHAAGLLKKRKKHRRRRGGMPPKRNPPPFLSPSRCEEATPVSAQDVPAPQTIARFVVFVDPYC